MSKKRLNADMDEKLYRAIKTYCAIHDCTINEFVTELAELKLQGKHYQKMEKEIRDKVLQETADALLNMRSNTTS